MAFDHGHHDFFSTNLRSDGLPTRSPPWGRIKFGPFFRPALGTQQRVTDSNACRAGTATEALWGALSKGISWLQESHYQKTWGFNPTWMISNRDLKPL
jgi:hypothetical protein